MPQTSFNASRFAKALLLLPLLLPLLSSALLSRIHVALLYMRNSVLAYADPQKVGIGGLTSILPTFELQQHLCFSCDIVVFQSFCVDKAWSP